MKKIITKFWGVALIVMLLSTLFVAATPVSAADPLAWNLEPIPGSSGSVLLASDILDFSIGSDAATIYAATGTTDVYKTTNTGLTWGPIAAGNTVNLVAAASDSTDVAVTVTAATTWDIRLTLDGGSTWSDFETTYLTGLISGTITDVDLSQEVNNVRYCAISTSSGQVFTRKFGNAWDEWVRASVAYTGYVGTATAHAISFSPNFPGDRSLVAVTENSTDLNLETLVFSATPLWNGETNYPASIDDYAGGPIAGATDASLALSPDYAGAGEVESIVFVGVTSGTATESGVYRMDDYVSSSLKRSVDIYSVAFDGSVVVAGTTAATVWRSENPLDSSPTFASNANMKGPDGSENTIVAFAGSSVVAGTSGAASGFSVSTDNGRSFAGISLLDTAITDISDLAVSADGSIIYLLTSDNTTGVEVSLFRYNGAWQRVLVVTTAAIDWIVRINSATDSSSIYVTDTGAGATTMYYSAAGGDTRWYSRSSPGVSDLAVESDSVVYAAIAGAATVMKSTNAGRFFNDAVATELTAGNINSMTLISENNLLVVSTDGYVSYSTDGNTSWTTISTDLGTGSQVTADGLVTDSHIYANDDDLVKMWIIGQATTDGWQDVDQGFGPGATVTGFGWGAGYLYANTATNFSRNNMPYYPELGQYLWSSSAAGTGTWDNTPTALRISNTDTYVKIWETGATTVYSYMDTLALVKPTMLTPVVDAVLPINTTTNTPYNITFTWSRVSRATSYTLYVYFDAYFTQSVLSTAAASGYTATESYTLTTAQLALLTPGTTYYWTVKASVPLSSGFAEFPLRAFTIESSPASVPSLSSPANGGTIAAGTSGAFSWSPVTGATMYLFELSDSPDFTNILYTVEAPNAGVLLPSSVTLTPGKTYFWRVKALSPVESAWSTIGNFTVAEEQATTTGTNATTTVTPTTTTVTTLTIPGTTTNEVNPGYIWAIIIIGAVLVIAVIVLIVRTRRSV